MGSGYIVVTLKKSLPGVRHEVYVFTNMNEAEEFASCIHARFPDAETQLEYAGDASDVFEHWSF